MCVCVYVCMCDMETTLGPRLARARGLCPCASQNTEGSAGWVVVVLASVPPPCRPHTAPVVLPPSQPLRERRERRHDDYSSSERLESEQRRRPQHIGVVGVGEGSIERSSGPFRLGSAPESPTRGVGGGRGESFPRASRAWGRRRGGAEWGGGAT